MTARKICAATEREKPSRWLEGILLNFISLRSTGLNGYGHT